MTVYTKPVVRISPLRIGESVLQVGRWVVELQVECGNGGIETIAMLLPARGKSGDSMTIHHHVEVSEAEGEFMGQIGFRPLDEQLQ